MFRSILVVIGIVGLAGAAGLMAAGDIGGALAAAIWGVILLVGTLFERVIYKRTLSARPKKAVATSEKFIDDRTGKPVTVYVDPATGERSYVEE